MNIISVKSSVAQADGFSVEVEDSALLGSRYFPNSDGDNFAGKEVLFDFDSADLEKGAFVTSGYKTANTVSWIANSVVPPRVGDAESVDPKDLDRQLFERLCRAQGADLNRAQAFVDLANIKAARLAKRIDRAIELLCALVLKEGAIDFDQDKTSAGGSSDHIQCKYYDPLKGCDNHFVTTASWRGGGSAHPYADICEMIAEGAKRGKRYSDLLLGADAWNNLAKDANFQKFSGATYHSDGMMLDFGEIEGAQHVAKAVFNGMPINCIVYSGAYKDSNGVLQQYIDADAAILISADMGRTLCGGVSLLADNVSYDLDNSFVDMKGKYIEHLYKDFNAQTLYIRSESRPLPAPKHSVNEYDWIYCDTAHALASNGGFGVVYNGVSFVCVDTSGQTVTPTTAPACTAAVAMGGKSVTITLAASVGETYKYFASVDGKKGSEIKTNSTTLGYTGGYLPLDGDRDANGKLIVICEEQ